MAATQEEVQAAAESGLPEIGGQQAVGIVIVRTPDGAEAISYTLADGSEVAG